MRHLKWFTFLVLWDASGMARAQAPGIGPHSTFETAELGQTPPDWTLEKGMPSDWAITADWAAGGTQQSLQGITRDTSASFLSQAYDPPQGPYAVTFTVRTHADTTKRGLSFGLSRGSPVAQPARAFHLAFQSHGQFATFNGQRWVDLAPYSPHTVYEVTLVTEPSVGYFDVLLNGEKLNPAPLRFWNWHPELDTFFLNNYSPQGEGQTFWVDEIRFVAAPRPPTPQSLTATLLSPSEVELRWEAPLETGLGGYHLLRDGQRIATLPPMATSYLDTGLERSQRHRYSLVAFDQADPPGESFPGWPVSVPPPPRPLPPPPAESAFEVLVYGGNPGGVAAAVTAARLGLRVALVEPGRHLGGMAAGGLGQSDIGKPQAIGGLAWKFFGRVYDTYRETYGVDSPQVRDCHQGFRFEPQVAEAIFDQMVEEQPNIALFLRHQVWSVERQGRRLTAIQVRNLEELRERILSAQVFIDASYEGDVAALAGVVYRVGREPTWEFGEEFAGVVYWMGGARKGPGSTGEGDSRVQAYTFRVCLTNHPGNRAPIPRPPDYNPEDYRTLAEYIAAKGIQRLDQCIYFGRLPNEKYDINNQGYAWQSTDYIEGNFAYPGANPPGREAITERHRNYVLGLLYFLQHDPAAPEHLRRQAQRWGLPRDEFPDTGHFPFQLYVRECRRMVGEYMFCERDARIAPGQQRTPLHRDSIACGSYSMDSHATTKWQPGQTTPYPEGFFYLGEITRPYQIPYRVLLPREVDALLVTGCVSATHVSYGTLRMEPVYMEMGQAAGTAAYLALTLGVPVRQIPLPRLQRMLAEAGQVLTVLNDVPRNHPHFAALTYCGTRGFFPSYEAQPDGILLQSTAGEWMKQFFGEEVPEMTVGEGPLTRAQMATWLASTLEKVAGWESDPSLEPQAADVGPDHPAFAAVQTLYRYGIPQRVWGETAGNFQPDAALTRAEFCALLYAAEGEKRDFPD